MALKPRIITDKQTDRATDGFDFYIDRIVSAPSQNPADTACRFLAVTEDYEALYGNPHREPSPRA